MRGDVEGHGDGVVGQWLDFHHPQRMELDRHQISLKWSNGSPHASQTISALQAVEPNSETMWVALSRHRGQRMGLSSNRARSRGGAIPPCSSLRRPSGVMSSVVQAGENTVRTRV